MPPPPRSPSVTPELARIHNRGEIPGTGLGGSVIFQTDSGIVVGQSRGNSNAVTLGDVLLAAIGGLDGPRPPQCDAGRPAVRARVSHESAACQAGGRRTWRLSGPSSFARQLLAHRRASSQRPATFFRVSASAAWAAFSARPFSRSSRAHRGVGRVPRRGRHPAGCRRSSCAPCRPHRLAMEGHRHQQAWKPTLGRSPP